MLLNIHQYHPGRAALLAAVVGMAAIPLLGSVPAEAALHLYVPDVMMAGEPYEGMVLLDGPPARPYPVLLAPGGGAAVPEMVVIAAGMNHATFPIRPGTVGPYTISAVPPDGAAITAGYEVYPGEGRRLVVAAPAMSEGTLRTAARDVPLLIHLVDHLGRPAASAGDTAISLDAPPAIRVPAGPLVVPANRTHILAMISVHGSGPVHVSSPGMPGDTLRVVMVDDPVTVRVGVAPDPAPAGTAVPYFVWLERGGRPYDPGPDVIHDVYVSTSSPAVADLRPAGRPDDAIHHEYMRGGLLRGTLYTGPPPSPDDLRGSPSRATVTASIPGVGSGSAAVSIGAQPGRSLPEVAAAVRQCLEEDGIGGAAARRGGCAAALRIFAMMNGKVAAGSGQDPGTIYLGDAGHAAVQGVRTAIRAAGTEGPADAVRLWAFPDGPSGTAWVVAGFYLTVPGIPEAAAPARPAGPVRMTLSGGSVPGAGGYSVGHPPVLAVPVEVRGSLNATLVGRGLEPSSIHLEGPGDRPGQMVVAVSAVPRVAAGDGIIGMVWVMDAVSGHLVEAGAARHLVEVSGYGGVSVEAVAWRGPASGVILGSWDGSVPGGVQARMAGSAPVRQDIVPYDGGGMGGGGTVSGIRLWAPGRVHISEEFPVVVHAVDMDGRPVSRIDGAALVSNAATTVPGGRMVAGLDGGGISAVWGGHSDRMDLEAFLNPAGDDIRVAHAGEGRVRLGENVTVTVVAGEPPAGAASVSISGTLDFVDGPLDGGTYTARPGSPGDHTATVTISRPGWEDHTRTIHWEVDHLVEVSYTAGADDGVSVPFGVILEESSGEGPSHRLVPGAATLVSPGAYVARIEERPSLGGQAYRLSGVDISGEPSGAAPRLAVTIREDTAISSSYERVVLVEAAVSGAAAGAVRIEGIGAYRFGEIVWLEAPRIPEWLGLVWLVPVSWKGLPGGATLSGDGGMAEFAALRSVDATVSYGRSYTVLILAMAAGAAAPTLLFRSALAESVAGAVAAIRGRGRGAIR